MNLLKMFFLFTTPAVVICGPDISDSSESESSDSKSHEDIVITNNYAFHRKILASGYGYFKSLLHLGNCKANATVTRVEVTIVGHGTNNVAFSSTGVGAAEFVGTIVFSNNERLTFCKVDIFSCADAAPTTKKQPLYRGKCENRGYVVHKDRAGQGDDGRCRSVPLTLYLEDRKDGSEGDRKRQPNDDSNTDDVGHPTEGQKEGLTVYSEHDGSDDSNDNT